MVITVGENTKLEFNKESIATVVEDQEESSESNSSKNKLSKKKKDSDSEK